MSYQRPDQFELYRLIQWLREKIPNLEIYPLLKSQVSEFETSSAINQVKQLPRIYLTLEQIIVDITGKEPDRSQLRKDVRLNYPSLLREEAFSLIFSPKTNQEILLCKQFLLTLLEEARPIMGNALDSAGNWIKNMPDRAALPLPLGLEGNLPLRHEAWIGFVRKLSREIYENLTKALGKTASKNIFEKSYKSLAEIYLGLEAFPAVIFMLPEDLLNREQIGLVAAFSAQQPQNDNISAQS
jgi:hypothetical protein